MSNIYMSRTNQSSPSSPNFRLPPLYLIHGSDFIRPRRLVLQSSRHLSFFIIASVVFLSFYQQASLIVRFIFLSNYKSVILILISIYFVWLSTWFSRDGLQSYVQSTTFFHIGRIFLLRKWYLISRSLTNRKLLWISSTSDMKKQQFEWKHERSLCKYHHVS